MKIFTSTLFILMLLFISNVAFSDEKQANDNKIVLAEVVDIDWGISDDDSDSGYD